jgi:hypothetical protein
MKLLSTYLSAFLFGATGKTIRVDKDHLPGLRAPKPLPKPPIPYSGEGNAAANDIDSMHLRFKATNVERTTAKGRKGKGIDFK